MGAKVTRTRHVAVLVVAFAGLALPLRAQPRPEPEGATELALALRRIGTTKRVLMVGAHPDDENTAVLAQLALGQGADVAYLSLTRGEGGQNLIGPELQEALGLIRTEELLSARRLDGAAQFFTRAYDFGYSRTADETFRHWPRDTLLADVVATVRRFRPDVIIAVFSGTPRDGHGQHQASGILAREAFQAAADSTRFPEQRAWGLTPHRTAYLFQALYRGDPEGALLLETGTFDPVLGRSYFQAAMASRSRHRSQDMGQPQPPGPQRVALVPVAGEWPAGSTTVFAALDTTLAERAQSVSASSISQLLDMYQLAASTARARYNPLRLGELVEMLTTAVVLLDSVAERITAEDPLAFHVAREREQAADALRRASGLVLDVTTDQQHVTRRGEFTLTVRVWNGGERPVTVQSVRPVLDRDGDGWVVEPLDSTAAFTLAPGTLATRRFRIDVAANARLTRAYFLRRERESALYNWPTDDPSVRGLPFEPPPIRATADVVVARASLTMLAEATVPVIDKSLGELRFPVFIVPSVSVEVSPRVAVVPLNGPAENGHTHEITVTLRADDANAAGELTLGLPTGWRAQPERVAVSFEQSNEHTFTFQVTPPDSLGRGASEIVALYRARDGDAHTEGYQVVAYPHTRPRTLYTPAVTNVAAFPVSSAGDLRVGYIEGAGDDGAAALAQLGMRVDKLDAATLARGDLARFDVIVAGIRAYEVRSDLIANNARVLDWVRAGGTFIVQYNKYELVEGGFTPYPLTMAQPHGRVTDEAAPVRLLAPDHPLLSWPNRITAADFEGWEQERGLYFADTWDERFQPLLEMTDPGEPPQRGSILVANVDRGHYVYTGLSLFRQWPAAVPGAYRLLANLVSLGRAPR
jgi:LmbE family N-acetylglucosaminyl deacetylase